MALTIEQRQYPVGKWDDTRQITDSINSQNIEDLLPKTYELINLVQHLNEDELALGYREGSWSIKQIVHHMADTHLFHFLRLKHTLTEEKPIGVIGNVNLFVQTADCLDPIDQSLIMLDSTHKRYLSMYKGINKTDYGKSYFHSFRQLDITVPQALDMVIWHLNHHTAHIKIALGIFEV